MKLTCRIQRHDLIFKEPAGTSRGKMHRKETWFILLSEASDPDRTGIGEIGLLPGLSVEARPDIEKRLSGICHEINTIARDPGKYLKEYPSVRFGLETALLDLRTGGKRLLFPSPFTGGKAGIPVNGLIWMGSHDFMKRQIDKKISEGYRCIKIKIGAIGFEEELGLISYIRNEYSKEDVEIRVDANGAFHPGEAMEKLKQLAEYGIHSIEQPVRAGQWQEMARICEESPVPVALDEELIPLMDQEERRKMLETVNPAWLILKPGLLGGFRTCEEWISLAGEYNTGWWVTSALESNVGLNAIAQWTWTLNNPMPQGLGTGQLFTNNIPSPLTIHSGDLKYSPESKWNLSLIMK